jgi:hypothetical protein
VAKSAAIDKAEIAKTLMQEYLSARQEVLLHVQLYKTPERNAAILIALVGLLFPLLSDQSISLPFTNISFHSTRWTDLVILFTISTIAFLMPSSALAVLFTMQVLAERCVRLEDEINKCLSGKYLFWERVAHKIWSVNGSLVGRMPEAVASVLYYVLILFFAVALPLFVLARNLCAQHDWLYELVTGAYLIYLFAVPMICIHLNLYTMGPLRAEFSQLLQYVVIGKTFHPGRSGVIAHLIALTVAVAGAAIFINYVLCPPVCLYIGARSATSDALVILAAQT